METCKVCNKEYSSFKGLGQHVVKAHDLTKKEYYDYFVNPENGKCKHTDCSNVTWEKDNIIKGAKYKGVDYRGKRNGL